MTMKRRTLAIILAFDAIMLTFALWYMFLRPTDENVQNYYVRIYVQHSDGSEKGFSFSTGENTLDNALLNTEESIAELELSDGKSTILSADGETAPSGMCWQVEVDGELAGSDLSQISVRNRGEYYLVLLDAPI